MDHHTYSAVVPDYRDQDNATGKRPGFLLEIAERDGGVAIHLHEQPVTTDTTRSAFVNTVEARAIIRALEEAIERAERKLDGRPGHPDRVKRSV